MNQRVDKFLDDHNMTYLFLLLANLEVERLNNLPFTMKKQLKGKITTIALEHIADNDIPDYVMQDIPEEENPETEE